MTRLPIFTNRRWLRAGSWVEVRSAAEILATLEDRGCLDALPFMPEMLQYCGKRFRVYKSAHKTCDTIEKPVTRRMTNAVHIEGLRCDGTAHGGCQAACLLFWKKSWLKPVSGRQSNNHPIHSAPKTSAAVERAEHGDDVERLALATRVSAASGEVAAGERFRCQATELFRATTPLQWWEPGPYAMDLMSGNVQLRDFIRYIAIAFYNMIMRLHWRGRPYPYVRGLAQGKTPAAVLNLQPGELVQVRSKEEIMRTINAKQRNRGLWFDVEMVPYCDGMYRVLRRVERIINEKTGMMILMPNDCVILEGVSCNGCLSRDRLFCPRSIYPYWREIWLKRVNTEEN